MTLTPTLARWITLVEKYVFSLFFFLLAYKQLGALRASVALFGERRALPFGPSGVFAVPARDALIFAFELFVGLTLLFNRAPVRQPEKPPDVLVPLLGTFFIYAFAFAHLAPAPLRESLMPVALRDGAAVAALLVSVAGYAVAVWSVVCLPRGASAFLRIPSQAPLRPPRRAAPPRPRRAHCRRGRRDRPRPRRPGRAQVQGADRRPHEGGRRQVRRHSGRGRGRRARDPRPRDQGAEAARRAGRGARARRPRVLRRGHLGRAEEAPRPRLQRHGRHRHRGGRRAAPRARGPGPRLHAPPVHALQGKGGDRRRRGERRGPEPPDAHRRHAGRDLPPLRSDARRDQSAREDPGRPLPRPRRPRRPGGRRA